MRRDCTQWLTGFDWSNSLAVTAHLSDSYSFAEPHQIEALRQKAYANNADFFRRLDRKLYGNAAKPKRGNKKVQRLAVVEIGKQRIHSHFLIRCPQRSTFTYMAYYIEQCWQKTPQGISDIDVQINEGASFAESFGGYLLKQLQPDNANAIDFESTVLPH